MSNQDQNVLALHHNQPITINAAPTLLDTMKIAEIFYKSRIVKSVESEAQACAKILAGQELGIGPMASLSQLHIVDGKPTMDATLVGAMIKKSGRYDFRIREASDMICRIEFYERGESVGTSSFSMDQARRAGLAGKSVWKSYPEAMLRSRAMTQGARMFCPDVFNGAVYDPSEVGADVEIDNSGSMKIINADPQRKTHELSPDEAELGELVKEIYSLIVVDPAIKGNHAHQFRMKRVADVVGLSKVPKKWSEFTLAQLREFVARSASANDESSTIEYCDICSNTDGTHREGCYNGDDDAATEAA